MDHVGCLIFCPKPVKHDRVTDFSVSSVMFHSHGMLGEKQNKKRRAAGLFVNHNAKRDLPKKTSIVWTSEDSETFLCGTAAAAAATGAATAAA